MVHGSGMAANALRFSASVDIFVFLSLCRRICVFCSLLLSKGCKEVGEIYWYICTLVINQPNLCISLFLLSGSLSPTCISSPAFIWWVHFKISPSLFNQKHKVILSYPINVYKKFSGMNSGFPAILTPQLGEPCAEFSITPDQESWIGEFFKTIIFLCRKDHWHHQHSPSLKNFYHKCCSFDLEQSLLVIGVAGSIQVLNCGHFRAWHVCPNKQCQVNPTMISPCITTFLEPSTA